MSLSIYQHLFLVLLTCPKGLEVVGRRSRVTRPPHDPSALAVVASSFPLVSIPAWSLVTLPSHQPGSLSPIFSLLRMAPENSLSVFSSTWYEPVRNRWMSDDFPLLASPSTP